jgi:hypothetical protein
MSEYPELKYLYHVAFRCPPNWRCMTKKMIWIEAQIATQGLIRAASPYIVILTVPLSRLVAPVAGNLLLRYAPAIRFIQVKRLSTVNTLVSFFRFDCFFFIAAPEHIETSLHCVGRCLYGKLMYEHWSTNQTASWQRRGLSSQPGS